MYNVYDVGYVFEILYNYDFAKAYTKCRNSVKKVWKQFEKNLKSFKNLGKSLQKFEVRKSLEKVWKKNRKNLKKSEKIFPNRKVCKSFKKSLEKFEKTGKVSQNLKKIEKVWNML